MTAARSERASPPGLSVLPWLWGARTDLWAFGGSAGLAVALALLGSAFGIAEVPDVAWIALVLGIDVAHVHSTWFRTYFDRQELLRKPARYFGIPFGLYALGLLAYRTSPLLFWRVLAYLAVFHFVRQQAGWVALYRARSGETVTRRDRLIDGLAIYAATLFPLFYWHAHADSRSFSWFVPGDFVALPLEPLVPVAALVWALALAAFFGREAQRAIVERRLALGKSVVVATTAVTWMFGIVLTDSDFVFTATNVIPHGVPYAVLLFAYTRERARRVPEWGFSPLVAAGFSVFALLLLGLAFVEELAWDRFVDHDRPWLFGAGFELGPSLLGWIVPLLALPQATHYVLDGLIWRRADTRALEAQRAALGFVNDRAPRIEANLAAIDATRAPRGPA